MNHLTGALAALGATTGTVIFTVVVVLIVVIGRRLPR